MIDIDELLRERDRLRAALAETEAAIAGINAELEELGIDPEESE